MEVLQESTYPELISKFEGKLSIISDKYISKYYWDEQLIEFEEDRMEDETGKNFHVVCDRYWIGVHNISCRSSNEN